MIKPDILERGEKARLIPVVADSSKENRALSILLAALVGVHEFRQVMLGSLGQRVGSRAKFEAWTEVVFKCDPKGPKTIERPDGLLILSTGKKNWRMLVEAKVGNAEVGEDQLACYAQKAREIGLDGVLTITNQFVAMPSHHPVKLAKAQAKGVELYHWSWMYAITQANLLLQTGGIEDPDQAYLLGEVVRYFEHPSSGVTRFTSMSPEWKELVAGVSRGAKLSKSSEIVEKSVSSWHQEQRDLCLMMTDKLKRQVEIKLSRSHQKDPIARLRDDCEKLATRQVLEVDLCIPDAADDLKVIADVNRRTIVCSMKLAAPKDKQRASARINWLVRQLPKEHLPGFFIKAIRAGRAGDTDKSFAEVTANPLCLEEGTIPPSLFEVYYVRDVAGKFSGTRTFIQELEEAVPHFYKKAVQHLRPWTPSPPKFAAAKEDEATEPSQASTEPASASPDLSVIAPSSPFEKGLYESSLASLEPDHDPLLELEEPVEVAATYQEPQGATEPDAHPS